MVKVTASPMQRGLLPRANFRGSDWRGSSPSPPAVGYGDGFKSLSLQSLLRSSGEPPVVPRLGSAPEDAGGPRISHRDLLGPVADDVTIGVRHVLGYDLVSPWPYKSHF